MPLIVAAVVWLVTALVLRSAAALFLAVPKRKHDTERFPAYAISANYLVNSRTDVMILTEEDLSMYKLPIVAILAAAVFLTGCASTLEGAGKDAKSAGKAIGKTADNVKKKF